MLLDKKSVIFLSVLFTISSLIGLTSTALSNHAEPIAANSPVDLQNGNETTKIKFTELNYDVLHIIFGSLKFKDILNVAEASPTLSALAADVFRVKKDNIEIKSDFVRMRTLKKSKKRVQDFGGASDFLTDEIYELVLKMLKHFGHLIQKIYITTDYVRNETRADITAGYISKYAAKSLRDLTWFGKEDNTIERFTVPFEGVERLYLGINGMNIRQPNLSFCELFPNLRRFEWPIYDVNYTFLECKFSDKLERVDVYPEHRPSEQHLHEFLRKNSHIKHFSLHPFFQTRNEIFNLTIVSQLLPQLESIAIYAIQIGNDTVHFENVKNYRNFIFHGIDKVSFARLESLRVDSNFGRKFGLWREFLEKHNNLSSLYIRIHDFSEYEQLTEATAMLPNLTNLTVSQYWPNIHDERISKLIDSNDNLKRIEIKLSDPVEGDFETLCNRFGNEWNVQRISDDHKQSVILEKFD